MTTKTEKKQKTPPHSKESEMMVLGCMLTSINGVNIASNSLDESDFYFIEHKIIFQALKSSHRRDKPADIHIIAEELKRQDKLKDIGGLPYLTTLAQYAGTSAFIEEYVEHVNEKALLRRIIQASQLIEKNALEEPIEIEEFLNDSKKLFESLSKSNSSQIQILPITERIRSHRENLERCRGKKYLGLCVKTIQDINERMLGLRKLILLAAAPNVGKTALTIQLATEVLLKEPDACLVYISLEMNEEEIFTRMNLYHSGLNFDTYVLGSQKIEHENERQILFTEDELKKIDHSEKTLEKFGDRLQIIDSSTCSNINANTIIEFVERLKEKTKCNRAIVVIDYLQVWPMPKNIRFTSDIEADKWRIGEIKKIRDALNTVNQDPVIVISEARKPSANDEIWGSDLSDVMGSARGTYTPDAVWLLSQLQSKQLSKLWEDMKMPKIQYKSDINEIEDKNDLSNIRGFLAHHGIAICSFKMPKGRDGMKKFNTLLAFHFHKNKFEPVDWLEIRRIASEEKNQNQSNSSKAKEYDENGNQKICKL